MACIVQAYFCSGLGPQGKELTPRRVRFQVRILATHLGKMQSWLGKVHLHLVTNVQHVPVPNKMSQIFCTFSSKIKCSFMDGMQPMWVIDSIQYEQIHLKIKMVWKSPIPNRIFEIFCPSSTFQRKSQKWFRFEPIFRCAVFHWQKPVSAKHFFLAIIPLEQPLRSRA